MNTSKLQKYKNASKVLTGMLAVTLSVGMITGFSWAEDVDHINDVSVSMTALDVPGQGTGYFDDELGELNVVKWKYKDLDENCIYVKIKHDKDIKRIEDEDEKERVAFDVGTKEVVARYELKREKKEVVDGEEVVEPADKKFKIVDEDGAYQWVEIGDVKLNVTRAYKNENGDVIAIAMATTDDNVEISNVTYLDNSSEPAVIQEVKTTLGQHGNKSHPIKHYEVDKGTTGVWVYLGNDEIPCEVQLALDWKAPEVDRLYRNASNTKMMIKAMDNESGIDKIFVDGRQITITGTDREVTKIIDSGVTEVKLYDAVGHETVVTAEEDATGPKIVLEKVRNKDGTIKDGCYKLTLRDHQSGLREIKLDGVSRQVFDNYPQDECEITLEDLVNVNKIYVYDALGNEASIDLRNVACVIVYTHSNSDGSKVAISLYEEIGANDVVRTIDKIGILNSAKECKIIEKMPADTQRVLRCYETPAGTTGIRVYYNGDQDVNQPADYVLDPYEVVPEVIGNRVISLVGINRIEYSDGRKVEFNESMPTLVKLQLVQNGSATVYDSLGNCNTVGE